MMKRPKTILLWTLLLIITLGAYFYLLVYYTKPSTADVDAKAKKITPVDLGILKTDLQKQTSGLEVNGQIPVTVNKDELGRDNPFAGF